MNLRSIKLIWARELIDQLRDRRTLFMVAILPLLMYPLMGLSFFQLSQFLRSHSAKVLVLGAEQLDQVELPPLLSETGFTDSLFASTAEARRLKVIREGSKLATDEAAAAESPLPEDIKQRLADGKLDVVVIFPKGFAQQLLAQRRQLETIGDAATLSTNTENADELDAPEPQLFFNSQREASQVSYLRVERLLDRWQRQVVDKNLAETKVPANVAKPFQLERQDVAANEGRPAAIWAKLLPFVMFVWALTGAFYPAVDLCAGEKERGTLETLLASPARRSEIVIGKLLTVMSFSMATALLNLLSLGITGRFLLQQFASASPALASASMGLPSATSLALLVLALLPISALFSALSLACASFARSTKEGQYYFMPLFLAAMPLMVLPMSPGVELNLGNAIAPVMGLTLLLRKVLEGQLGLALKFAAPVVGVTLLCCYFATQWAISQFNKESVLFRESERLDLAAWLRSLIRDRKEVPTAALAVVCIGLVFMCQFFLQSLIAAFPPKQIDFGYLAFTIGLSQACVLIPSLVLAAIFVRKRLKTFMLNHPPRWGNVALAALLAVAFHPVGLAIVGVIQQLYPLSDELIAQTTGMAGLMEQAPSIGVLILLMACLPAVVEEITFRGFVLSGLKSSMRPTSAVILTAIAFGVTHTILQQSMAAAVVGLLIGAIAITTRSLWPCIVFHAVYNSLPLLSAHYGETAINWLESRGLGSVIAKQGEMAVGYHPGVVAVGFVLSGLLLWRLSRSAAFTETTPAMPSHSASDAATPVDGQPAL